MSVRDYVVQQVTELLRERRIVVWYDPNGDFGAFFRALPVKPLVRADASASLLEARRAADEAWRAILDPQRMEGEAPPLLVYVPHAAGADASGRMDDPFEAYALAGATFGAHAGEQLQSLARRALAGREHEVDRLFATGRPTIAQLDTLAAGARYPALRDALRTDVPVEVAARLMGDRGPLRSACQRSPAVQAELLRMLERTYGFHIPEGTSFDGLADAFARWLFVSEFAFDLPSELPAELAHHPRADDGHRQLVYDLCDKLRSTTTYRDAYMDAATQVERTLGLAKLGQHTSAFGDRDTFPFEDEAALRRAQELALEGAVDEARALLAARKRSVWHLDGQRDQLWRLLGRCLDLLHAGKAWAPRAPSSSAPVADQVRAYCDEPTGLWRVDQAQRLMEQAAVHPAARDGVLSLLEHARIQYRAWVDAAQDAFLTAVGRDGWPPPEGVPRQTSTWARHVGPAFRDNRKVAYFLVDALRFEMGRELARALETLGQVTAEPAAGVVPAETMFGMAALLPGAEASFTCRLEKDELVPVVGDRPIPNVPARVEAFRAVAGSRFRDIRLGDLLAAPSKKLRDQIGAADLVLVRSTEIDEFGERNDPVIARQLMSEVLGHVVAAATRLVDLGFRRFVFAADHGFVQLPEVLPGDSVPEPAGAWHLKKRRSLIGEISGRSDAVVVLSAPRVGLIGPVKDVVVARRMRVFRGRSGYFHEGVSLQECVIPVVVLEASAASRSTDSSVRVELAFKADRFTNRIFLITAHASFADLLSNAKSVAVRFVVEDQDSGEPAGKVGDLDEKDDATGAVVLHPSTATKIPVVIGDDYLGKGVVIRAMDPARPGVEFGRLKLANDTL